jgi:tRNA pseudouridine55 synthase
MDGVNFDLSKVKNGVLLVDKPQGWTSFDVVAKIRGQIRAEYRARGEKPTKRQQKVGHAGTLDPFATGLLVVLLGDATKKADEFLKLDKVYEATIRLGQTSTTGDPEGELTDVSSLEPSLADIEQVIAKFIGKITQTPPKFSAIKVNGQRAYKLAHKGLDVEIPSRQVVIYSIEILESTYPELRIRTHVGSGTYIRTLAEDIGNELHTGAYCSQLRRTRVGRWSIDDIVKGEPND